MLVAIDPGHGGDDPGAKYGDVKESDITLMFSTELYRIMEWDHKPVMMTRLEDKYVSLMERCRIANDSGANVFVSIHANSCPSPNTARGVEIWHHPVSTKARELANDIIEEWAYAPKRGVKEATFTVLTHTKMPAVLIEIGFINNDRERNLMLDEMWRAGRIDDIIYGLKRYEERHKGEF